MHANNSNSNTNNINKSNLKDMNLSQLNYMLKYNPVLKGNKWILRGVVKDPVQDDNNNDNNYPDNNKEYNSKDAFDPYSWDRWKRCSCPLKILNNFIPHHHVCEIIHIPPKWNQGSDKLKEYYNDVDILLKQYIFINDLIDIVNGYIGKGYMCIHKEYPIWYKKTNKCVIYEIFNVPSRTPLVKLFSLDTYNTNIDNTKWLPITSEDIEQGI